FKGIGAIGSVAWITLPFLILSLNFSFILAIGHGQTSFLYPLMGNGSWQILKTSIKHFGLYADFFFFFVLITLVPNKKIFKKVIWLSFGLVIFALTASMVTFLMVFDFESIHLVSYPYHELIRFISIGFLD